jgi:serine phosphatase RsbU (regulator of sigma subunit)
MQGYDLYWKILWADKISGDAFGIFESKNRYHFFLWDATGHGIKAWFIVTLLSRLFNKHVKSNNLQNLTYEINNGLKQDLQSRNFITWVFFEVSKEAVNMIDFVWMWHEPILVYREKEDKVEKIIPGWLAAWIRMIKNKEDIKTKAITMQNNDILMVYSDWIVENKNPEWEYYGIERLQKVFHKIAAFDKDINRIYEYIISDVQLFRWWSSFLDDASILILKRNENKDLQEHGSQYLSDVSMREWLKKDDMKKLEWKTKEEIRLEIENIKKEKETKRIIKSLENLYYTWEVLKLKQEAIRFIREGFIHKKINYYLKKALANEKKYKIEQKNIKLKNKYNVLEQLEKKWDYDTVIREIEDVITRDGNL